MDEALIVSAIMSARRYYDEAVRIGLDRSDFNEVARGALTLIMEQYSRDPGLKAADLGVLRSQIERKYGAKSGIRQSVDEFVTGLPPCPTGVNILEEYRLIRLHRVAGDLATRLAMGQHGDELDSLLERYKAMRAEATGGDSTSWRMQPGDFEGESGERLYVSPRILNDHIGGGVLRGHNITVYGRPESGKSMFALNQAAAACVDGKRVLYVANEEPARDITTRLLARMAGTRVSRLRSADAVSAAIERAGSAYDNWFLLHKAGAGISDVRAAAQRVQPDWIIVDQLKNLRTPEDNRALQLDKLARDVRALGSEFGCATMSVTQAGDSAQGRRTLQMNDIEWSNTGIPGAADLLIGIGVDDELDGQGKRMLSFPKNKINGKHGYLPVYVDPDRTAFLTTRGKR